MAQRYTFSTALLATLLLLAPGRTSAQLAPQGYTYEIYFQVIGQADVTITSDIPDAQGDSLWTNIVDDIDLIYEFDWAADFGHNNTVEDTLAGDFDGNQLYTLTFTDGTSTLVLQYLQCERPHASYDVSTHGFYCLYNLDRQHADISIVYTSDSFSILPHGVHVGDDDPPSPLVIDVDAAGDFVWPHDRARFCGTDAYCNYTALGDYFFTTETASQTTYTLTAPKIVVSDSSSSSLGYDSWTWVGKTIKFPAGAELIVEGELVADGMTFEAASTTWDGIEFSSGSSGSIDSSTIEDVGSGRDAIYMEDASPAIWYNDITSAGNGIWAEGSGANPVIRYNTLTVGSSGIVFYGGGGYVQDNTITGDGSGSAIGAGSGGDPILGQEDLGPGDNVITDFYWGLNALSGSTIWSQGYDCISDIGAKHLRAVSSSDVTAELDWWGGSDPLWETVSGGTVDWTPRYVGSCPASGASKMGMPLVFSSAEAPSDDLPGRLLRARILREEGRMDEAVAEYKALIEHSPRSAQTGSALLDLGRLARRTIDESLAKYLEDQAGGDTAYRLHILGMLIGYYLGSGDEGTALDTARLVADEGAGTWHAFSANWQAYRVHAGAERWAEAADALSEMKPFNEFDEQLFTRLEAQLSERAPIEYARINDPRTLEAASDQDALEANVYPNPFNPTTTITFRLDENATVRILVYDIMGRLVARVSDDAFPAGTHRLKWDASRVASGVYTAVVIAGNRAARVPLIVTK